MATTTTEVVRNTEQDLRRVAEELLASTSGYHSNSMEEQEEELVNAHASAIRPHVTISNIRSDIPVPVPLWPDIVISEDLIAGQRIGGKMSNVRRFFCLFVTFDLLFTGLMWLICVMVIRRPLVLKINMHGVCFQLNKIDFDSALKREVLHYNIHSSLFDIVMAATCRFTVLLLFYALLYLKHWLIISITTAGTCAFLICKVFVFNWTESQQPVFQVLLILASFILAWSEAWFFDFRVTPQETHAERYLAIRPSERGTLVRNFRFPSFRPSYQRLSRPGVAAHSSQYADSNRDFYSPLQSPEESIYDPQDYRLTEPMINVTEEEELQYKAQGLRIMEEAWRILNNSNWKMDKQSAEGDTIETTNIPKVGKTFRLTGVVNIPPRYLLDELFYRIEDIPLWNNSVLESRKMSVIDEYTDITYQVSPEGGSGMVTSRDFVSLRHWGIIDGCYISASVSIAHRDIPKNSEFIRGENGIGCWVMRPINEEPNKCVFQWMLNTNLKGWIPQYIIDASLTSVMFDYLNDLRNYASYLRTSGQIP